MELFIKGRRLLYDKIELFETEDKYVVNTHTWYEKEPSEAFFILKLIPKNFLRTLPFSQSKTQNVSELKSIL